MRLEVAQLWCEALRSGEFIQGKGFLDKGRSHCAMGVLVNLAMTLGVCDYQSVKDKGAFDNETGRIPKSVQEWAEMYGQNGEIKGEFVTLSGMNDVFDYTFTEIADIIELNVEKL